MSEPTDDPADLLPDYLTRILLAEEERTLFAAAAANQDFFNQLMEAEALRDALSSPEQRNRLKTALQAWHEGAEAQGGGDCDYLNQELTKDSEGRPSIASPSLPVDLAAQPPRMVVRQSQRHVRVWYRNPIALGAIAAGVLACLIIPYARFRWTRESTSATVHQSVRQPSSAPQPESSGTADSPLRRSDHVTNASGAEPSKQATSRPPHPNHVTPLRAYNRGENASGPEIPVLVIEEVVGPADYRADGAGISCEGNNESLRVVNNAAALLSTSSFSYTGNLMALLGDHALVARDPTVGSVAGMVGRIASDPSIPCHPLIAVIPVGSQIIDFRYSARDGSGDGPCKPDDNGWFVCEIGWSKFTGPPTVTQAGKSLLVTGMFVNWSHDRERSANMTVSYQPSR
jgi:hypothetical protein